MQNHCGTCDCLCCTTYDSNSSYPVCVAQDQKIFLWREEIAEQENVPPTYIFKDKYLKHLSKIRIEDEFAKKKIMKILGNSLNTENFIKTIL